MQALHSFLTAAIIFITTAAIIYTSAISAIFGPSSNSTFLIKQPDELSHLQICSGTDYTGIEHVVDRITIPCTRDAGLSTPANHPGLSYGVGGIIGPETLQRSKSPDIRTVLPNYDVLSCANFAGMVRKDIDKVYQIFGNKKGPNNEKPWKHGDVTVDDILSLENSCNAEIAKITPGEAANEVARAAFRKCRKAGQDKLMAVVQEIFDNSYPFMAKNLPKGSAKAASGYTKRTLKDLEKVYKTFSSGIGLHGEPKWRHPPINDSAVSRAEDNVYNTLARFNESQATKEEVDTATRALHLAGQDLVLYSFHEALIHNFHYRLALPSEPYNQTGEGVSPSIITSISAKVSPIIRKDVNQLSKDVRKLMQYFYKYFYNADVIELAFLKEVVAAQREHDVLERIFFQYGKPKSDELAKSKKKLRVEEQKALKSVLQYALARNGSFMTILQHKVAYDYYAELSMSTIETNIILLMEGHVFEEVANIDDDPTLADAFGPRPQVPPFPCAAWKTKKLLYGIVHQAWKDFRNGKPATGPRIMDYNESEFRGKVQDVMLAAMDFGLRQSVRYNSGTGPITIRVGQEIWQYEWAYYC